MAKRRRKYRRRFRRRFYRRRGYKRGFRRIKRRRITQVRQKSLFTADRQFVKLRKQMVTTMQLSGTAVANNIVRSLYGNSVFEVFVSGSARGQPTGRDQWFLLYNWCTVLGSKIKITFSNATSDTFTPASAGNALFVGVYPSTASYDLTSPLGTVTDLDELPNSKWRMLGNRVSNRGLGTIKHYMSTKKIYQKGRILDESEFMQSATGNWYDTQSYPWYWNIFVQDLENPNPSGVGIPGGVGPVRVLISITYYCCFSNPKDLAPS